MPYYGFDIYYIVLVLPAFLLAMYAQSKVKGTFNKFSKIQGRQNYTGAEVAENLLHKAGVYDVTIERVRGNLTDHYDPRTKVLRLSDSVYDSRSIAAIGVAAHETGHAIQHATDYTFLLARNAFAPIASLCSGFSNILVMIGLYIMVANGNSFLLMAGIFMFTGVVLFHIITLPVEFDASKRAITLLQEGFYVSNDEAKGAKKVLNAAALTYVASTAVAIASLLRLLLIVGGRSRD